MIRNNKLLFLFIFFLVSCSSVPKYPSNACKIFEEKYFYLKHTRAASKKWGVPISSILAVINMESGFKRFAKPKRTKIFKIIPYRRPSSSFGFSQAIKSSWELYKKENNKPLALRTSMKSSSDFVGWYFYKSNQINNIPLNDIKKLYLSYYLGWGNYKNKTYRTDQKAILLAKKVQQQADKYRLQLKKCQKKVNRKKYIIY